MAEASEISFRPATAEDEPLLRRLFEDARHAQFSSIPLEPAELKELIDMQFRAQLTSYRSWFPNTEFDVVLLAGKPVGYRYVAEVKAVRLLDIVLLPDYRGQGIGSEVMARLLNRAKAAGKPILLEVEHDNPAARRLYERFGFEEIGRDELRAEMRWAGDA